MFYNQPNVLSLNVNKQGKEMLLPYETVWYGMLADLYFQNAKFKS